MNDFAPYYSMLVLGGGFLLLALLAMRGHSIFVVAPLCAALILAASGADPVAGLTGPFMAGFTDYMRQFYLIFALGAAFGKLMEKSGAASVIARAIARRLGPRWACLAVVLACAVLTYGGVSLFVVGFSVYPLAVQLFRAANLPRRFIPASIAFGSVTFTMTTAGSPEIQNLIPIKYLVDSATNEPLTYAGAGWPASICVAVTMFALGQYYLEWAIRRDLARGERFQPRPGDPVVVDEPSPAHGVQPPGLWTALMPLLVTLLVLNLLPLAANFRPAEGDGPLRKGLGHVVQAMQNFGPRENDLPTVAILAGVMAALLVLRPRGANRWVCLADGFVNGLIAIGSTCSVVGFGWAIRDIDSFQRVVAWVTHLPVDPLIGAALAVAVIAGLAGSASGGQGLALPIIKPIYIDQLGVAPRALHRVVAISSGTLDTLPANGYLVMLLHNICGETHARAYWPICVTCTLIPMVGTALAILLFKLFPAWGTM